ncbi:MAG: hypothetical protein K0Q59_1966 [Paenibacillus sp.]|jgi:spore germination protein KC|nr:hypothetical protein [Paenibacillus sp.]
MDFISKFQTGKLIIAAVGCLCLSGCWDIVEVNQIAIVNLVGLDKDPESREETVYYQVINPTGISGQKSSGVKSPVYTYRVNGYTSGEVASRTLELLPRRPFFDHYQALIVSERFAKDGVREMINFIEKQSDRRSETYLLVADSPLKELMETYIPLERLPGRNLRSMIELQSKYTNQISDQSRIKDLAENLESDTLTVLPIVSLSNAQAMPTTERFEQMNANVGNILLSGGAIFKHDRMIGKLKHSEMPLYYLLNNRVGVLKQSLIVNEEAVDVSTAHTKVRKALSLDSGKPVLKIDIIAQLELIDNDQKEKLTLQNLADIKREFNWQMHEKASAFYNKMVRNGWDIVGVEEQIKRKRGKEWAAAKKDKTVWQETKLDLTVNSTIGSIGNTLDPYQ